MQDDAIDHTIPIATLLRRALILARRLDYSPIGEWAQRELEGYPKEAELPPYRAYRSCRVVGDFNGVGGSRMTNQPLPSSVVDEGHRRGLFGFELRGGVSQYEALADTGDDLAFPWAMDVVAHYQMQFIEGWGLADARRVVSAGEIRELIDAVRTRLLNFTLEIEAANPDAGEATGGGQPIPLQEVRSAFQVHVMGNHNIINAAGGDATQEISFEDGRWDELRQTLEGLGVPDDEVAGLKAALQDDASTSPPGWCDGALDRRLVRKAERCGDARCDFADQRGGRRDDRGGAPEVPGRWLSSRGKQPGGTRLAGRRNEGRSNRPDPEHEKRENEQFVKGVLGHARKP